MPSLDLAPFVTVTYWRTTPVGISPVRGDDPRADFALVMVADVERKTRETARFEIPSDAEKLAIFVAGARVARRIGQCDQGALLECPQSSCGYAAPNVSPPANPPSCGSSGQEKIKPSLWVCFAENGNICAWSSDADRAALFRADGLNMCPFYRTPAGAVHADE